MDKLAGMRAFVAVYEENGFSSASRKSGITKALLSKYVAQLEDELGTRLFQRSTRQVLPTDIGRAYYERCLPLLEELDELEAVVHDIHKAPSGDLKLSAPISFSELHLMKVVSKFSRLYPDIRINMMLCDRPVDIVGEGYDLAIRIGNLPDSSLVARQLGTIRTVACASPIYLERAGEPQQPDDLVKHQCIIDTNISDATRWRFVSNGNDFTVTVTGLHFVNSAVAIRELILEHTGIAICPMFVVGDDIKAGRLNIVLNKYEIQTYGLYAIYSHRRHLSAKVRLFIDSMIDYFDDT